MGKALGLSPSVIALLLVAVLTACGDDDDEPPAAGGEQPSAAPPEPPDAKRCAAEALRTSVRAGALVPDAGTYEVAVEGTSTPIEAGRPSRPEALPRRGKLIVTPARGFGNVRCFTTQTIRGELRTDATFAVRGEDIYLTASEFDNGASRTSIAPAPPILAVRAGELEWSGSFGGPTRGSYRASVVGRRTMTVGGQRVRVVGIRSQTSFAGEQGGTDDSTRWISLDDNLVVLEEAASEVSAGGDRLRLRARTRLLSLEPSSGP